MREVAPLDNLNNIWKEYQSTGDTELRSKLILEYAPIVKYVAGRLAIHLGQHMDFDDLISYGVFGLIDAIDKFDMLKGVKFETYASLRIRGAIIDGVRSMDWVPRTLRQKNKKVEQSYAQLETELGREPTDLELAQKLSLSVEKAKDLVQESSILSLVSLDGYLEQNSDIPFVSNSLNDTPENHLNKQELRKILTETIESLSEKERMVVTLYYFEELSLREISKIMKVSESRISQIHSKSLLRMQGKLGEYKHTLFS